MSLNKRDPRRKMPETKPEPPTKPAKRNTHLPFRPILNQSDNLSHLPCQLYHQLNRFYHQLNRFYHQLNRFSVNETHENVTWKEKDVKLVLYWPIQLIKPFPLPFPVYLNQDRTCPLKTLGCPLKALELPQKTQD